MARKVNLVLSSSLGIFAGFSRASMLQIETDLVALTKNQTIDRSFDAIWAQNIIASIDGYGCWCYG